MRHEVVQFRLDRRFSAERIWRNALRTFMESTGLGSLPLRLLTRRHLYCYRDWLFRHQKSRHTINVYIGALQTAYNRMTVGTSHHVYGLFKGLRACSVSTVKRAVSERTMARLVRTDAAALPTPLQKPFGWFVLMFLLRGIPFVDLAHLRKSDFRDGVITYRRQKTGREMSVEVPKEASAIIRKYASECSCSPYLLPILKGASGSIEEAYKEYQCALRRFNLALEKLSVVLRTDVRLSSYTARHTWATIAYYQGYPVGVICKALGHSSVRVTEFYLKPFANRDVDKTNKQIINRMKRDFDSVYGAVND